MSSSAKVRPMKPSEGKLQQLTYMEGTISNSNAGLIKLLMAICLAQVAMFITTAATLGVFVSANVKEINVLKQQTGTLQADMTLMQHNTEQGETVGLSSTNDVETKLSQLNIRVSELDARMQVLEADKDTYITGNERKRFDFNQTSYQLALNVLRERTQMFQQEINENLTSQADILKTQSDEIEKLINDIHHLESITELQNTSIYDNYVRLSLLDTNTIVLHRNLSLYNFRLTEVEDRCNVDNITVNLQFVSSRIASLEREQTNDRDLLSNQTIQTSTLEACIVNLTAAMQAHDSKLTQIESDQSTVHDAITNNTNNMNKLETIYNKNNSTLSALTLRIKNLEFQQSVSEDRIIEIENILSRGNETLQAHGFMIEMMASDLSQTQDVIIDHSNRIIEVESKIAKSNTTLQNMNERITNLESEVIFNSTAQTVDPNFVAFLRENVIPIQTILNNTQSLELLETTTSNHSTLLNEFMSEVNKAWGAIQELTVDHTELESCPDGFVTNGNTCYLFSRDTAAWAEAALTCQMLDSTLVEIEDSSENTYLKNIVKARSGDGWYIGAIDKAVDGEFVWMNSKRKFSSHEAFTDWYSSQPNGGDSQGCLAFWYSHGYQWGDVPCDYQMNYICETHLTDKH